MFDEQRITEELQAQNQITKEFGKEAPKAVGDFAVNRQLALIGQGKVDEADKWAEGGAYRVALHTLVGAIATGSVEGALASGTTAVSIPAVSDYLDKQGVDETTKNALLLGLSTAAGAIVGGDTASTASSVNQTQNNYLNHIQLQNWVDGLKACNGNSTCVTRVNDIYQKFDKQQQNRFNSVCEDNFNIAQCKDEIANYNNAYPSSNIAEPLYKQIGELGGGPSTYINVRNNNGYSIQNRDRAIAKIARAEGKPVDALINELWYASLYGSGRSGPVVWAKAPAGNVATNKNEARKPKKSDKNSSDLINSNLVLPTKNSGTAQSRVNVATNTYDGTAKRGFNYAIGRHGVNSTTPGKSRYSISDNQVKSLLQESKVVKSPVYNQVGRDGKIDTEKFIRQVDTGRTIGRTQDGKNTSVITIITNRKGELINTFPGTL